MRSFVLGDLHGAWKAMKQCLEKASFDYSEDRLIFLGDVADGWPDVPACIEEFRKIRHLVFLMGNHDQWFLDWLATGTKTIHWLRQGGNATVRSYEDHAYLKEEHLMFLENSLPYYLDTENRLFVHAGFTFDKPVESTEDPDHDYFWNREIYKKSFNQPVMPDLYPEIYIGHTPTNSISNTPLKNHNIWLMDQGAGWNGYLSMMNIDTKEVFQSDNVLALYPDDPGRLDFSTELF